MGKGASGQCFKFSRWKNMWELVVRQDDLSTNGHYT